MAAATAPTRCARSMPTATIRYRCLRHHRYDRCNLQNRPNTPIPLSMVASTTSPLKDVLALSDTSRLTLSSIWVASVHFFYVLRSSSYNSASDSVVDPPSNESISTGADTPSTTSGCSSLISRMTACCIRRSSSTQLMCLSLHSQRTKALPKGMSCPLDDATASLGIELHGSMFLVKVANSIPSASGQPIQLLSQSCRVLFGASVSAIQPMLMRSSLRFLTVPSQSHGLRFSSNSATPLDPNSPKALPHPPDPSPQIVALRGFISKYRHLDIDTHRRKDRLLLKKLAELFGEAKECLQEPSLGLQWWEYEWLLQNISMSRSRAYCHERMVKLLVMDLLASDVEFGLPQFTMALKSLRRHPSGIYLSNQMIHRLNCAGVTDPWDRKIYQWLLSIHITCNGTAAAEDWFRIQVDAAHALGSSSVACTETSAMPSNNLTWDSRFFAALIEGYSQEGDTDQIVSLLSEAVKLDCFSGELASYPIRQLCAIGKFQEANAIYQQYRHEDYKPHARLFENMIWGTLVAQFRIEFNAHTRSSIDVPAHMRRARPKLDPDATITAANSIMTDLNKAGYQPSVEIIAMYLTHFMIRGKYSKAISLYDDMTAQGMAWNYVSLTVMIKVFFSIKDLDRVNQTIDLYDRSGFDRDLVFYGTLMDGMSHLGEHEKSLEFYQEFLDASLLPDDSIYNILLSIHGRRLDMSSAENTWKQMEENGIRLTEHSFCILIHGYGLSGNLRKMEQLLEAMSLRKIPISEATYNTLMNAHINNLNYRGVQHIYERMLSAGIEPGVYTFNILLKLQLRQLQTTKTSETLKAMHDAGIEPTNSTYISLIRLYSRTGHMDEAQRVHRVHKTKSIYNDDYSNSPSTTRVLFLNKYSNIGDWDAFEEQLSLAKEEGIVFGAIMYEALIQGFYRREGFSGAERWYRIALDSCTTLGVRIFNKMIQLCIRDGFHSMAIEVVNEMLARGIKADIFTYTWLLRAGIVISDTGVSKTARSTWSPASPADVVSSGDSSSHGDAANGVSNTPPLEFDAFEFEFENDDDGNAVAVDGAVVVDSPPPTSTFLPPPHIL
ncbi:hypothetical protein BASA60_003817 [Batrachochytrium salamandrivorans]|nr:hypothetical protein BASA60_003817 [Batrachochytrium salamandrivorans]